MKLGDGEVPRKESNEPKSDLEAGQKQPVPEEPSKETENEDVTLVRPPLPWLIIRLLTTPGDMEWPRGPRQPQELANKEEVVGRRAGVTLHIHLPSLLFHGSPSSGKHRSRV